jgi:hypothetical protein
MLRVTLRSFAPLLLAFALPSCDAQPGPDAPDEPAAPYAPLASGVLVVQVRLAADLPVAGARVVVQRAGTVEGAPIEVNERGDGADYRAIGDGSELRAAVDRDGVRGTLRAALPSWNGVDAQALDPFTTLVAAWLERHAGASMAEGRAAVRGILGIPERVPEAQILTATKWFSGRVFIAAAPGGDLDALVAQTVALTATDTPRFGDPNGDDTTLQFLAPVVGWLVTKAKENAFSGIFGAIQGGYGFYSSRQERQFLINQFNEVNGKLNELRASVEQLGSSTAAGLRSLQCDLYATQVSRLVPMVRELQTVRSRSEDIERLRLEFEEALPDLVFYPYADSVLATLTAAERTKYDAVPGSQAYGYLQTYRAERLAAFQRADTEARRVGFPGVLVGLTNSTAGGQLEALRNCIRLDRTYLTRADQEVMVNEVQFMLALATELKLGRLAIFEEENARAIRDNDRIVLERRAELVKEFDATNQALTAGSPNHLLEALPSTALTIDERGAAAEAWIPERQVVLRVAEQVPLYGFGLMLHASDRLDDFYPLPDGRHTYSYVNFLVGNERQERQIAESESSLFTIPPSATEKATCAAGSASACPGTFRNWLLRSTGGTVGADRYGLDRFDLFRRSIALGSAQLTPATWRPDSFWFTTYSYQYYFVYDLEANARKKVILYNDSDTKSWIRHACLGGWSNILGGGSPDTSQARGFQEPPSARPYTIAPPAGKTAVVSRLFSATASSACIHSTRDRFGSRLVTVRPDAQHVLLWDTEKAKDALRRLGLTTL